MPVNRRDIELTKAIDDAEKGNGKSLRELLSTHVFLGDYDSDVRILSRLDSLAKKGNDDAKVLFAMARKNIVLLEEVANKGHQAACCELGLFYSTNKHNHSESLKWYKKAKTCDGPTHWITNDLDGRIESEERFLKMQRKEEKNKPLKEKVKVKVKKSKNKIDENIIEPSVSIYTKIKDPVVKTYRKFCNQIKSDIDYLKNAIISGVKKFFIDFIWNRMITKKSLAFSYISLVIGYGLYYFGYINF